MRYLAVTSRTLLMCWGLCACDQAVSPAVNQTGGVASTSSSAATSGGVTSTITGSSGGMSTGGDSATNAEQGGTSFATSASHSGGKSAGGTTARTGGTSAKGGTSSSTGGTKATASGGATPSGGSTKGGTSAVTSSSTAKGGASGLGGFTGRGGTSATGGVVATGGSKATGGTTGAGITLPKITNGQNGTTTRYWDCCMPSCSWKANAGGKNPVKVCGKDGTSFVSESSRNACDGGGGFMCYWGVPWSVSSTVSYGYAAHNGAPCGTCFQLDFTSGAANGKSMIVQVINIGGLSGNQFDLLIPGGGVGAMNACNANGNMWNGLNLGEQFGGLLKSCGNDCNCMKQKCQSTFGSNSTMLAGCNWFTDWFQCADNPNIVYKEIACPSDITNKSGISG